MSKGKTDVLLGIKSEMESFMKKSVPFWLQKGIDNKYGGYLVCFDEDGKPMENLAVLSLNKELEIIEKSLH